MILGIDEVGRGPWAGPLVVGAVVLGDASIDGLTDSKKLSAKRRDVLNAEIRTKAAGWGLGWVHANELDELGLSESLRIATIRAVEAVKASYSEIIIDGTINFLKQTTKGEYVTTLTKADLLIPAVSAASIVAKVAHDAYMAEQAVVYPQYGFEKHVGYGTALHRKALDEFGVTPLHRTSFAPIAKMLASKQELVTSSKSLAEHSNRTEIAQHQNGSKVTTKQRGDEGETKAVQFLESNGHVIVDRNWKTKLCEIDIVSQFEDTTYFVEVKYRKNANAGEALTAVTKTKLKQMAFAAEYYAAKHPGLAGNQMLAVISITGNEVKYLQVE